MRLNVGNAFTAKLAATNGTSTARVGKEFLVALELVGGGFEAGTLGSQLADRINLLLLLGAQGGVMRFRIGELRGGSLGCGQALLPARFVGKLLREHLDSPLLLVTLRRKLGQA